MFSKKKRVTKELFQAIMKNGRILSSPLFVFRYMPKIDEAYAFVAPKSVSKKAPVRNKLRRQGYSALRTYDLPHVAGIFFYKKEALKADFQTIKSDIGSIVTKIKV